MNPSLALCMPCPGTDRAETALGCVRGAARPLPPAGRAWRSPRPCPTQPPPQDGGCSTRHVWRTPSLEIVLQMPTRGRDPAHCALPESTRDYSCDGGGRSSHGGEGQAGLLRRLAPNTHTFAGDFSRALPLCSAMKWCGLLFRMPARLCWWVGRRAPVIGWWVGRRAPVVGCGPSY